MGGKAFRKSKVPSRSLARKRRNAELQRLFAEERKIRRAHANRPLTGKEVGRLKQLELAIRRITLH